MPDKKNTCYFDLPGEIRNQIYSEYIYSFTKPIGQFSTSDKDEEPFCEYTASWNPHHPFCVQDRVVKLFNGCLRLFLVNKQVYSEVHSLFYDSIFGRIGFAMWRIHRLSEMIEIVPDYALSKLSGMLGLVTVSSTRDVAGRAPAEKVLDLLAEDFGYIDALDMKSENRDQTMRESNDGAYWIQSKFWSRGVECWMVCAVDGDHWSHEIFLGGTLGKLKHLRDIEKIMRNELMFGWHFNSRIFDASESRTL
jgi:hypothetical protein